MKTRNKAYAGFCEAEIFATVETHPASAETGDIEEKEEVTLSRQELIDIGVQAVKEVLLQSTPPQKRK